MRIIFICGSLESGKDGVGDYTRRLGCELIRQGHEVGLIALNDKRIQSSWQGYQSDDRVDIQVIRLSAMEHWKARTKVAKDFIQSFQPEWISLQYVPYAFQNKGVPFGLAHKLKTIGGKVKWHIMFHELWVGIQQGSSFSHFIYKTFQQSIVKGLYNRLAPKCVHTNNIVFQLELKRKKVNSTILPLFSNIQFYPLEEHKKENLFSTLQIDNDKKAAYYLVCVFGSIYHWKELIEAIKKICFDMKAKNKMSSVLLFGRNGSAKNILIKELTALQIRSHVFGEVNEETASLLMQVSDVAVCCTSEEFMGKSGVYAAFRAHGLPVVQSNNINIPSYIGAIQNFNHKLEKKPAAEWHVSFVAKQFINDLNLHPDI